LLVAHGPTLPTMTPIPEVVEAGIEMGSRRRGASGMHGFRPPIKIPSFKLDALEEAGATRIYTDYGVSAGRDALVPEAVRFHGAQLERDTMIERTRAGLAAAAANGRKGGRPRKLDDADEGDVLTVWKLDRLGRNTPTRSRRRRETNLSRDRVPQPQPKVCIPRGRWARPC
jgi:hypothetical protein